MGIKIQSHIRKKMAVELVSTLPTTIDGFSAIEPPNVQPNEKKPVQLEKVHSRSISCMYGLVYCSAGLLCPCISVTSCLAGIGYGCTACLAICCPTTECREQVEKNKVGTLCRCCGIYNGIVVSSELFYASYKHFKTVISPLDPGVITEMKRV